MMDLETIRLFHSQGYDIYVRFEDPNPGFLNSLNYPDYIIKLDANGQLYVTDSLLLKLTRLFPDDAEFNTFIADDEITILCK